MRSLTGSVSDKLVQNVQAAKLFDAISNTFSESPFADKIISSSAWTTTLHYS